MKVAVGGAALALVWGLSPFLRRRRVTVAARPKKGDRPQITPPEAAANEDVEVPWGVEV